ncbi:MAG TPA: ribonuclease E activity regulator RraA [Steroidobacteraceae bacterium]|jgi:regulator of ribonuclease activity A|nr:ribonuclease E activity regulator RraA [Steroidobacteraceae bacterium]
MTQSTSDLYDHYGERLRVMPPVFQDFGGRTQFSGEVVTVRCFEDNSRLKELLSTPGAGKVLLVDGGGSQRCALMGDLIAGQAVTHGWEGVVIYGCVRDRIALKALNLGIRALGATPRKSLRRGEGQTQLPIEIGGVSCRPGDRLVADEDGIVLLDPNSSA